MPPTAQDVYNEIIQALSPTERLRLATLILNELVQQNSPTIDQSDTGLNRIKQMSLIFHCSMYVKTVLAELDDLLTLQIAH